MKSLLLVLAALVSNTALANTPSFYCHGMEGAEGMSMFAKILSADEPREGEDMEFLFIVRDGSEEIFREHVSASQEDVMLSFRSQPGSPKMNAMIYLDEYDQTWVKLGRKTYRFNCH